jgi:Flp pilus assembly protein TadG
MTTTPPNRLSRLREVDGQSAVEFALVLPVLAMLFMAIWQCGVAFHRYIVFTDAARVGARKAAVSLTPGKDPCQEAKDAIQKTVSKTQWKDDLKEGARISCSPSPPGAVGTPYTISITYPFTISVVAKYSGTMTASATERLE